MLSWVCRPCPTRSTWCRRSPVKSARLYFGGPGRDTVAVVKDYVAHFYPGMIGLTGTEEQVAAAARAYRVYYRKSEETAEDAENYLVDHSSIIYVMGTDGRYLEHFTHATPPKTMADRLMKRLGA